MLQGMVIWTALHTQPQLERQPVRPLPVLERRQVELEQQLARQRLERQQPRCVACNSLHFPSAPHGADGFCFVNCPFQPPSIFPISSSGRESAVYFFVSSDLVSQSTMRSILRVSNLRMASRTHGCFSLLERKVAAAIASIVSMNNASAFAPSVWRCALGSV